jgi:FlaA1/EpsC-like NDP-sugar epimerase
LSIVTGLTVRSAVAAWDISRQIEGMSVASDRDEFTGKRILVTGGTKGVGETIVKRLRAGRLG